MEDRKDKHTANDWQEFLEAIQDGYRYLYSLKRKLSVIPEEAWRTPGAEALRKELVRIAVEVVSREAIMEHCRSDREPVPNYNGPQGTA